MAKAWKIPYLNADQPLNISLRRILRTRFAEMVSYEEGTLAGEDIEYLHSMRVSSRRVQAMMKIFRGAFPKRKFKHEYEQIRTLIRSLGAVRELDVFVAKLEAYRKNMQGADMRSLDLLIARQRSLQNKKRKEMIQTIKRLNRAKYKENFELFVESEL
jgi:CHAD domain-containing protein